MSNDCTKTMALTNANVKVNKCYNLSVCTVHKDSSFETKISRLVTTGVELRNTMFAIPYH